VDDDRKMTEEVVLCRIAHDRMYHNIAKVYFECTVRYVMS
jgi:hypothetical protein